ncbi:hypothetical protein TRFO_28660 [Tritrichomonas foetus]|uniref:Myb-like DNA-binding domain containing protein n=1 Tax=Tritrichomonas foetus TaxID=1144522 RepID=A0A1J4JY78_9EUKA|nr:hypothetical protein TRFO_28660 [Tritrichomonas foetus]|eukprot:OHT03947.1 hypothetical protein TRFO_28660 [Tritrichomonas foetus]
MNNSILSKYSIVSIYSPQSQPMTLIPFTLRISPSPSDSEPPPIPAIPDEIQSTTFNQDPSNDIDVEFASKDTSNISPVNSPAASKASKGRKRKKLPSLSKKMKKWTPHEDDLLRLAVEKYGTNNWGLVAAEVGGNRGRAQCSQRWTRGLNPAISHDVWTPEENAKLLDLVAQHGTKSWMQISSLMANRCDVQCRYRFSKLRRQGETIQRREFAEICDSDFKPESSCIPQITVTSNRDLNDSENLNDDSFTSSSIISSPINSPPNSPLPVSSEMMMSNLPTKVVLPSIDDLIRAIGSTPTSFSLFIV